MVIKLSDFEVNYFFFFFTVIELSTYPLLPQLAQPCQWKDFSPKVEETKKVLAELRGWWEKPIHVSLYYASLQMLSKGMVLLSGHNSIDVLVGK